MYKRQLLAIVARIQNTIATISGKEPSLTPEAAAITAHNIRCDSSKAEQELEYRAVPLHTLVEDTVKWMTEKGLLR